MNKEILAAICIIKGHKHRAIEIYRGILQDNPISKNAEKSLRILQQGIQDKSNLNDEIYKKFINAESSNDLHTIERWLSGN